MCQGGVKTLRHRPDAADAAGPIARAGRTVLHKRVEWKHIYED